MHAMRLPENARIETDCRAVALKAELIATRENAATQIDVCGFCANTRRDGKLTINFPRDHRIHRHINQRVLRRDRAKRAAFNPLALEAVWFINTEAERNRQVFQSK